MTTQLLLCTDLDRNGLPVLAGGIPAVLEGVVHDKPEVRDWLPENTDTVHANGC